MRADNQIDQRLAAHDLFPLGLGNTARNTDLEVRLVGLQPLEAAQLGIDLLRCLLPDMTCVQKDHVRIVGRFGFNVTFTAQRFGHAFTVIDIHLTAIGLDKQLLRSAHGDNLFTGGVATAAWHSRKRLCLQCQPDYPNLTAIARHGSWHSKMGSRR